MSLGTTVIVRNFMKSTHPKFRPSQSITSVFHFDSETGLLRLFISPLIRWEFRHIRIPELGPIRFTSGSVPVGLHVTFWCPELGGFYGLCQWVISWPDTPHLGDFFDEPGNVAPADALSDWDRCGRWPPPIAQIQPRFDGNSDRGGPYCRGRVSTQSPQPDARFQVGSAAAVPALASERWRGCR